ncbi:MAG: 3-phosphoshikimate 1-carboxyvinyltransferase [Clostridia bacterium]|nr:3-phosphoshikimate 1-carboxyvinyltransferase [Clostridia bacterium]
MKITLQKTGAVTGVPVLTAPPSKSDAHRLLILSALSAEKPGGGITLFCRDTNADIDATVGCLNALGADIARTESGYTILPIDRNVPPADENGEITMDVGESGSTLRFLIPVVGALGKNVRVKMHGRLPHRPLSPLDAVLTEHGMTVARDAEDESILHLSGQLTAGNYTIDGGVSSQFISGLLFALPLLSLPSELHITGTIASAPYINLTLSALRRFGYVPKGMDDGHRYDIAPAKFAPVTGLSVEGDWSGAAFLLCAGAMSGNGVCVKGLSPASVQGDRRILDVLTMTGCTVTWCGDAVTVVPPKGGGTSKDGVLNPFSVNADDIPDLVPPMAALACACRGRSVICGCQRLKIKESDRLAATVSMLGALGGNVFSEQAGGDDRIVIGGIGTLSGGACEGYNDHRMVMSASLCALLAKDGASVTVTDREAIRKSYPGFFDDFGAFGITEVHGEEA